MSNPSEDARDAPVKEEEPPLKSSGMESNAAEADTKNQLDDQAKNDASDDEEECNKIPFPVILHEIVCDPATDHCIHWLPNGNLFTIADKKKFAKEVLPKLNGHAKFTSFTRRLKRWGFTRIASGPQIGAYQNPDFTKDDPERVKNIKYMHPKPLSMSAIQKQNAKLQAAKINLGIGGGSFGVHGPDQDLRMLQTLIAQQQQMGMQIPGQNSVMEAYMRLAAAGGNDFAPNTNMAASANNQSMAMQLAMLQEMQNQHKKQQQMQCPTPMTAAAAASAPESPKNESFGEKLVRTNPALAAQLIDAKSMNMMSPQGMGGNNTNPMMAMLASQGLNQMQQQNNMNPSLLQQMGNQGGDQQNLTAMMFALLQQEQQQQQLQQQKDFIKNFMGGQMNQQPQAATNSNNHRGSISDSSLLVTPSSSAPILHAGLKKSASGSDENWLSALLTRNNNAGNASKNPEGSGKSGDT